EIVPMITDRRPITIDTALRQLNKNGLVRVCAWQRNIGSGGRLSPVWSLADGKGNAPRPIIKNASAEAKRRYDRKTAVLKAMKRQKAKHGTVNPFYQIIYTPRADKEIS